MIPKRETKGPTFLSHENETDRSDLLSHENETRMRKAVWVLIAVAALAGVLVVMGNGRQEPAPVPVPQEEPEAKAKVQESVFKGEVVSFGVYSGGIFKVGSGRLELKGLVEEEGEACQHVDFKVSSFSVDDHEVIIGRHDFSLPVRVVRDIRVFGRDEDIVERYSPDGRRVVIDKRVRDGESEETVIDSEQPLGNVLLLIYRLREDPDLAVGREYDINLPTTRFKLVVKEKKPLKVPLGRFDAFYIESEPKKYRIWLSADPRRLPLRIQGLVAGGMAYLAAVSVEPPLSE